jgi:serine/threonine protein kinase
VDQVCDEFEDAWKQGRPPELGYFAQDLDTPVGKALLRELLKLDLAYRLQRREPPKAEEYEAIFPDHATLIAAVFAEAANPRRPSEQPTTPPSSSAIEPDAACPSQPPPVPGSIGRYKVIRRLGGGTYGDVYLAHDADMDREVAVKVPSARLLATDRAREEFLREARSVARLKHEGVVRAYDFGEADGQCFIVYEYLEGESLAKRTKPQRLAANPIPSDEAARIVAAVAESLHYAHLQGIFHRDIKPANILLDKHGRPKVTDFGSAVREEELPQQRGLLAGTYGYMSPEQARREGHHIDGRTDIYSLGVVLYELLCGRRPFEASTKDELEDQILHREARPPRQIKDSIPAELERICLKALSKRINDRFATANDMAAELRQALRRSESINPDQPATPSVRPLVDYIHIDRPRLTSYVDQLNLPKPGAHFLLWTPSDKRDVDSVSAPREREAESDHLRISRLMDHLDKNNQLALGRPTYASGGQNVFVLEEMDARKVIFPGTSTHKVSSLREIAVWISDPSPEELSRDSSRASGTFVYLIESYWKADVYPYGTTMSGFSALTLIVNELAGLDLVSKSDKAQFGVQFSHKSSLLPIDILTVIGARVSPARRIRSLYRLRYVSDEQYFADANGWHRSLDVFAYPIFVEALDP